MPKIIPAYFNIPVIKDLEFISESHFYYLFRGAYFWCDGAWVFVREKKQKQKHSDAEQISFHGMQGENNLIFLTRLRISWYGTSLLLGIPSCSGFWVQA